MYRNAKGKFSLVPNLVQARRLAESGRYFDWFKFLGHTSISQGDWDAARLLSSQWVTCGCGQLCKTLQRACNGRPEDETLVFLGYAFHEKIAQKDRQAALAALALIEHRVGQILRSENSGWGWKF